LLKHFNAAHEYDSKIVRASNLLGRKIKVGNDIMFDASLMLDYLCNNFNFSLGYNFWYRSKDTCNIKCKDGNGCACIPTCYGQFFADTYGIKGVAPVRNAGTPTTVNNAFFSKSDSNIHASGTEKTAGTTAVATDYVLESDITADVALSPSAFSNKIFGYIGYRNTDYDNEPFFGIGAMYEFGQEGRALCQAGIYFNVGVMF
jgi:hypothetical protein